MTDNQTNTTPESDNPPAEAQNTESNMIPKSRFNNVIDERNQLRERLAQLESAAQQQREQQLAEQNRYKELYEEAQQKLTVLETAQQQAQRYQEALGATNQARLERIPEERRTLVPEYDDPVKLGAWLDANEALLLETPKPTPPTMDGGSGSGGSSSTPPAVPPGTASVMDIARQHGYEVDSQRVANFARNQQRKGNQPSEE